jgi:uncharacterized protein (TIGR02453 family)
MAAKEAIFSKETFQFFRELKRNNKKEWMDKNRERYREVVVKPLKRLLEEMAPTVLQLDQRFETTGARGANFSRINRDIRFSKDKTLYKTNMYVKFPFAAGALDDGGELYAGVSENSATAGFRIYGTSKRKESTLTLIARPRLQRNPKWLAQQEKRLGRKYESYWYSNVKGQWTANHGWPRNEDWPKLQAWVVRKKLSTSVTARPSYRSNLEKIFRDLYPLAKFVSLE